MEFKDKLKKTRKKLGLTQIQFADKTGFSRSTISEYENGNRKITLSAIKKLALATNTNTSDWLAEDIELKEINIIPFDGLKIIIDTLIEVGEITKDGECSTEAKNLLMKMLEKEVKLYVNRD